MCAVHLGAATAASLCDTNSALISLAPVLHRAARNSIYSQRPLPHLARAAELGRASRPFGKRTGGLENRRKLGSRVAPSPTEEEQPSCSSPVQRSLRGPRKSEAWEGLPVAIIGGGLSGLACGLALMRRGIRSTVFDTGKRAPGGRASSRLLKSSFEKVYLVDHAVQAFTAQIPEVKDLVAEMEVAGAVQRWHGAVGTILPNGSFHKRDEISEGALYIGSARAGMGGIAKWFAKGQDLKQDVWVARLERDQSSWNLLNTRRKRISDESYSYVVMAHNGKCADRLIKSAPAKTAAHAPLRCKFTSKASPTNDRLELSSLWVCVLAVPKGVADFEGAFVETNEVLSWVGNNSAKYNDFKQETDAWTVISTPEYGSANKCSQEFIPDNVRAKVSSEMCAAFGELLGGAAGSNCSNWEVLHLQLWGAALPLNVCGQHFVHDPINDVGICGDWLTAPSVEGAIFSGLALAGAVEQHLNKSGKARSGRAPRALPFKAFGGHAIGAFGGGLEELSLDAVQQQALERARTAKPQH